MTILVFKDRGDEVATTVWTACAKGERVDLAYLWGADGISWAPTATGTTRVAINLSLKNFLNRLSKGDLVVDLRDCS
jgi:hypothetical protein